VQTSKHVQGPLGGTPLPQSLTALSGVTIPPSMIPMVIPRSPRSLIAKIGTQSLLVSLSAYWDTFQPLKNPATQVAPKGVGVPVVKPQHKPHQHQDSVGHHYDRSEWRGETALPIVPTLVFGRPPWSMGLKDFLQTLVFWKTTQFPVLAAG
jgi:hypothetical protein